MFGLGNFPDSPHFGCNLALAPNRGSTLSRGTKTVTCKLGQQNVQAACPCEHPASLSAKAKHLDTRWRWVLPRHLAAKVEVFLLGEHNQAT